MTLTGMLSEVDVQIDSAVTCAISGAQSGEARAVAKTETKKELAYPLGPLSVKVQYCGTKALLATGAQWRQTGRTWRVLCLWFLTLELSNVEACMLQDWPCFCSGEHERDGVKSFDMMGSLYFCIEEFHADLQKLRRFLKYLLSTS